MNVDHAMLGETLASLHGTEIGLSDCAHEDQVPDHV